jgi:hypothetical protein
MAVTYEKIATNTLGSNTATVTFSSIPSTYTDLFLVINGGVTNAGGYSMVVVVNGDTSGSYANYSETTMAGQGSSGSSSRFSGGTSKPIFINYQIGFSTDIKTVARLNFMNYSNSTTKKTVLIRGDRGLYGTEAAVALWSSTAAITTLDISAQSGGGNLISGSSFTLYGIKAA